MLWEEAPFALGGRQMHTQQNWSKLYRLDTTNTADPAAVQVLQDLVSTTLNTVLLSGSMLHITTFSCEIG